MVKITDLESSKNIDIYDFAKFRALRVFVPSRIMRLRALRALIFTRLNYAPCVPYLLFARLTHSRYKIFY